MHPGWGGPVLLRPSTARWSEDPILGDPYDALVAEISAAQQAGWFVTGVACSRGGLLYEDLPQPSETPDSDLWNPVEQIVVGFAKPADDLDHAEAAYVLEGLSRELEPASSFPYKYGLKGTIRVAGVAPHHADRGWPKYVPVQLKDTCIADPHHPRLLTKKDATPKTNPPPPEEKSEAGPLDQTGKPFARWDDSSRFDASMLKKPISSTLATPST
jgi:hypothetical protein